MVRNSPKPLTPYDAKNRLREVGHEMGLRRWIVRRPAEAMTVGMAAGLILGSGKRSYRIPFLALRRIIRLIL